MTEVTWEDIPVPAGSFIGWGDTAGQHVTGRVVEFDPAGGTDFNDNVCPQVVVELTEPAASFNKAGERTDFQTGELITVTCGLVRLKRAINIAQPSTGDLIKIVLSGAEKTANGTMKLIDVKIARGNRPAGQQAPAPAQQATTDPFSTSAAQPAPPF